MNYMQNSTTPEKRKNDVIREPSRQGLYCALYNEFPLLIEYEAVESTPRASA